MRSPGFEPGFLEAVKAPPLPAWQAYMSPTDLMSWTRLDDDRAIHVATSWRIKAWWALSADLGAKRQLLVWRQ